MSLSTGRFSFVLLARKTVIKGCFTTSIGGLPFLYSFGNKVSSSIFPSINLFLLSIELISSRVYGLHSREGAIHHMDQDNL